MVMMLYTFLRVTEKESVCAETMCFKLDMDCKKLLGKKWMGKLEEV